MDNIKSLITMLASVLSLAGFCLAQENVITPDLSKVVKNDGWKIVNRNARTFEENGKSGVYLDEQPGDGIVWLQGFEFNNGTIEVDLKGRDIQGASFVGIALRGVDENTYDAVYFRPFNFLSQDSLRRGHSVQYISHPTYTWEKLRQESPGKYENKIDNPPDPNSFFHAKIVVQKPKVTVFVNDNIMPSLVVGELSERKGGRIGLWVSNYSDGYFANLKIIKKD